MTNLVISTVCNQECSYCFTIDRLKSAQECTFLAPADLACRLDFLKRSGIDQARLLGGEPTLHPRFAELVARIRQAGLMVVVFSNGLIPEPALSCLASLPADECLVIVNVGDPEISGGERHVQRAAAIRRLGTRAMPGFNICRPDLQLDFLLSMIAETNCQRAVRLGMAHPCLSGDNSYVHPNQYVAIGRRIAQFARTAARARVRVEFDCGFVRCMFSERDWADLGALGAGIGSRCNPILDVDVNGEVMYCYPLAGLGTLALAPDVDANHLRAAFVARTRRYREAGIFQECTACPFKSSGECTGGCLAATIRRFRHTPFQLAIST